MLHYLPACHDGSHLSHCSRDPDIQMSRLKRWEAAVKISRRQTLLQLTVVHTGLNWTTDHPVTNDIEASQAFSIQASRQNHCLEQWRLGIQHRRYK